MPALWEFILTLDNIFETLNPKLEYNNGSNAQFIWNKNFNSVIYLKLSDIYYGAINFHHHSCVRPSSFEEWLWTLLLLMRYFIVLIGQGLIVFN